MIMQDSNDDAVAFKFLGNSLNDIAQLSPQNILQKEAPMAEVKEEKVVSKVLEKSLSGITQFSPQSAQSIAGTSQNADNNQGNSESETSQTE